MIEIKNKYSCCGCEACVQVCPKHCISFDEDKKGFRYPNVETNKCIDCGLCEKVCLGRALTLYGRDVREL